MRLDATPGGVVDDRADVGAKAVGAADTQLVHRAAQHLQRAPGHVVLHAQQAQRRAALAGAVEGRGEHVGDDLLGERRRVDDHGVDAAGLGDQQRRAAVGVESPGERGLQPARHRRRAGEEHAAHAGVGDQRGADRVARAGHELQCGARHAGAVQQAHRLRGDQRRLRRRLGEHGATGGERRRDLSAEDGEREVPRADADHRADGARLPRARRDRQLATRLRGVIAQEVDRLAHLADAVGHGAPGLAGEQPGERRHVGLQRVGGAFEEGGARRGRRALPAGERRRGGGERVGHVLRRGGVHVADDVVAVGRVAHRRRLARVALGAVDDRHGAPGAGRALAQGSAEGGEARLVGEVDARRVGARRAVQRRRQRDRRMRQAGHAAFARRLRLDRGDRVGDQRVDRHRAIGDAVDEGGVGAVFQQPAHQVGEQRAVVPTGA